MSQASTSSEIDLSEATSAFEEASSYGDTTSLSGETGIPIRCVLCNMFLNGPLRYEQHLAAKKHRKNAARAHIGIPLEGLDGDSASSAPDVPEGHVLIPCLAMSGRQVGHITLPRFAMWGQMAAEVVLRYPDYRPLPPANARDCIAGDVEAINIVTGPIDDQS